jgi:chromosome segregation ATPase
MTEHAEDRVVPTRHEPMTYAEAERRMQGMAQRIRDAERDYERAVEDAANAEAVYRKSLGERFGALRSQGNAVEASMTQARGELFNLSRERDIAVGRVRKTLEVLEDRRGDRASLHKLVDWSGGVDVIERRNPRANGSTPYGSDD